MKILIDIIHAGDVNFYKNIVRVLDSQKHEVVFTVIRRGKVPELTKQEFSNHRVIVLGKHYQNFAGKLFGILSRELGFIRLFMKEKFDVVSAFGFYPGMTSRLFGIRAIHIHDDKEYKKVFELSRRTASTFISICPTKKTKNTLVVNSYKELSYLYPGKIHFDNNILKKMGLKENKYIYVRDVANISLNYSTNKIFDYSDFFRHAENKGYKIVYNPEGKTNPYPSAVLMKKGTYTCEEMIALKKNAALIVTSGDTVLREGALIGTPTIYTSSRNMAINRRLAKAGLFKKALNNEELFKEGKKMLRKGVKKKYANLAKKEITKRKDMTEIVVRELTK